MNETDVQYTDSLASDDGLSTVLVLSFLDNRQIYML
jgi:hypothetical protein